MPRPVAMLSLPALILVLGACASPAPPDSAHATHPAAATTNALAGTPMSAYGTALNRAKNVQAIVNQQAQKQAAAIDAATGSSSD